MKKQHIISLVFCAILFMVVLFSPIISCFAFADESIKVQLLSTNYNGINAISFTPFDFAANSRLAGKSLEPTTLENNQLNYDLNINYADNLVASKDYELGCWVYFSTKNLHNFKLTLIGTNLLDNEVKLIFNLSKVDLQNLLEKSSLRVTQELEGDGFGWNYLQLPFNVATNSGAVENGSYVNFTKLNIEFTSESPDVLLSYAKLYFYDINISLTDKTRATILESNKQDFRFCKFDFKTQAQLSQLYSGDKLSLRTVQSMLAYAWIGSTDVKTSLSNYVVHAYVINGDNKSLWEFSTDYTFNTIGTNIIKFEISKNDTCELWQAHTFTLTNFVGMKVNQINTDLKVGAKYRIFLTKNSDLTSFSNLNFEIIGNCARILSVNTQTNSVDLEVTQKGNFTLKATAQGGRLYDNDIALVASKDFSVTQTTEKDNSTLIILGISLVAICVGVGIYLGIKAIISANKYKVK